MDVAQHLSIIWRRKWAVLLISVVIAAIVYALSASQADVYRAEAVVALTPARQGTGSPADESTTLFLSRSYAALAGTRPVIERAVTGSKLRIDTDEADRRISVTGGNAGFLTVASTGPTTAAATALAQAEGEALLATVRAQQQRDLQQDVSSINSEIADLERQLTSLGPTSPQRTAIEARYNALVTSVTERQLDPVDRLDVVAPARAGGAPVSPLPKRNAALAFFVALVVNAELFVLLERLSDRFSSEELTEDMQRVTGLPVLTRVPEDDDDLIAEAFNTLRTNLLFMEVAESVRTVAVVSVEPAAGKSFTAIRMAQSIAKLNVPTVLVDGDIRRPVLHERLALHRTPGLSDVLNGRSINDVVQGVPGEPMLALVPSGPPVADPAALLGGRPLRAVFAEIPAEMVVVDTPAESLFADAAAIASQCDIAILVIDLKSSRRRTVQATLQRLRQVNVNLIGVVINRAEPNSRVSYYNRYRETEPARSVGT